MNKCQGCGDITERDILCDRCFRIKNYNEYKNVIVNNDNTLNILNDINSNDIVVLVVDLLNIPHDLNIFKKKIKGKIILALSKFDLMPTNNINRFVNYFDKFDLNFIEALCISSTNNYNLDLLYETIKNNTLSNNVYFVGYTNAGKSSLINKLIYNYSNSKSNITISSMPNTTIGTIKVKLKDFTLIDTPGIMETTILDFSSTNLIKKLSKGKKIKPISFQTKNKNFITIEDIIKIEADNDVIIYMPSNLQICRYYKDKIMKLPVEKQFDIKDVCDIVIPGLGFIKVKSGHYKISVPSDIQIFVRKSLI